MARGRGASSGTWGTCWGWWGSRGGGALSRRWEGQQQQWPEREEVGQQQCRPAKREKQRVRQKPVLGLCVGRTGSYQRPPAASLQVSLQKQVGLGKTASFSIFLVSSPWDGGPLVGLGRKGPKPWGKWPPSSRCCAELTTSWTPCLRSSSAVTWISSLYWEREGVVTSPPSLPWVLSQLILHQFYPHLPSQAAGCQLCCCHPGLTAAEHPGRGELPEWLPV